MKHLLKKYHYIIGLILCSLFSIGAVTPQYSIHNKNGYQNEFKNDNNERILFILDYSNSMTESIEGKRKIDLMVDTMKQILPKINPNTWVGLRIYGHKMGFTPIEACHASKLVSPILQNNVQYLEENLTKLKPRGMTPITYSLKQAVQYDFLGYNGKKHIILLTDGGENCDESPCSFVMDLIRIRRDITIDVIAFNIENSDDLKQLECTALVTSGKFYDAQTAAELLNGFNESINSSKQVEAKIIAH